MTFTAILVANRGEIASRVFRSARQMGMRCVAIYVAADSTAPFVSDADEAILLSTSYLDGPAIIEAALLTGAQAIHPGYGFLAENAMFATDVATAGLKWVGPSPEVISLVGDKLVAKQMATDADVPTLPSKANPDEVSAVGYPILVKAAAGGGGKGMRIVTEPGDLDDAIAAARREAAKAFGDDRVFFERYIAGSRHIEVQILGDAHGNIIHLGERECSIQRRHQKVIEETPSSAVNEALREDLTSAALRLANAIGYESAGTVEFLLDDQTGEFFFLEVNTRLQVEHAVTELVTGIDLVREQLRIAAGDPLEYTQQDVRTTGHAIEARLYAEDPANSFLPAIGRLHAFAPPSDPSVRWDVGVAAGSVVGVDFDPMLAKATSHAPTRSEAAGKLALALERLHIGGVTTNRDFLAATLRHRSFIDGDTTTDFIERIQPDTHHELNQEELGRAGVAAAMWLQASNRDGALTLGELPSGFRNSRLPPQRSVFAVGDQTVTIHYRTNRDGSFTLGLDRDKGAATVHQWSPELLDMEWANRRTTYQVTREGDVIHMTGPGGTTSLELLPRFTPPGVDLPSGGLRAPMPGAIIEVRVKPGDEVETGQTLIVLEAMKMEHHVDAPASGTIAEIRVSAGDQVDTGTILIVFKDDDGDHG